MLIEQEILQLVKDLEAMQTKAEELIDKTKTVSLKNIYLGEITANDGTIFKLKTILKNHNIETDN